ncbi:MAG: YqjD family protein [Hyphomonas sp.]|jgi:ElaB/YqjD/DUF883 family membrane-anchored ribosome-binding protein
MARPSSNTSRAAKDAVRNLEARLAELRSEIDGIMAELADKTGAKATATAEDMADTGEWLLDDLRSAIANLKRQASEAEQKVVAQAREHPVQSLAVAFGVGFLVSMLLRR